MGIFKGTTNYDAIRIIENDDGLFVKLNDATFSRTNCDRFCEDGKRFLPLTLALDCEKWRVSASQFTTSKADLRGTSLKFSPMVLPYYPSGWNESGEAILSSNNQILTSKSKGWCATLYFVEMSDADLDLVITDDHPELGYHLLRLTF